MIIVRYQIKCDSCGATHNRLCDLKEETRERAKRIWIVTMDGKHFCSPYCQAKFKENER